MAENEEELKSLFMKVKGENEKVVFKLIIQKNKIGSSLHGKWWGNNENNARFYFCGAPL